MSDYLIGIFKLLAENTPGAEIQKAGKEISNLIESDLAQINSQKKILDEILGWKAPVDKAWEKLASVRDDTVTENGDNFKVAVRDILKELVAQGKRKTDTTQIYGMIINKGVASDRKNPKTAIGNIIYWTPGWKKGGKKGVFVHQDNDGK